MKSIVNTPPVSASTVCVEGVMSQSVKVTLTVPEGSYTATLSTRLTRAHVMLAVADTADDEELDVPVHESVPMTVMFEVNSVLFRCPRNGWCTRALTATVLGVGSFGGEIASRSVCRTKPAKA